jgi:polysaccharide export outer membrane protein
MYLDARMGSFKTIAINIMLKKNNNPFPLTQGLFVGEKMYGPLRDRLAYQLNQFFLITTRQCLVGVIISFTLILDGCAFAPGFNMESGETGDVITLEDPTSQRKLEFKVKPITPELVSVGQESLANTSDDLKNVHPYAYRIGAADILEVDVWNHPELTAASGSGSTDPTGFIVHDDGTIFFPYAGVIQVAGKTVSEVRVEITQRLDEFIENPQVGVSVGEYRSQPVYMFGEVITPATHFIDRGRVTLAEVIATAGGINPETSNPNRIYVIRGNLAEPTIFWLKSESPVAMILAKDFTMQPHDIVFVQPAEITRWARVIGQLLPSTSFLIGTIGAAAAF